MTKTTDKNESNEKNLEPNYIKPGKGERSTEPQAMGSEGSEGKHKGGYASEGGGFGGSDEVLEEE